MKKTNFPKILVLLFLAGLSLSGCTNKNSQTNNSEIAVTNSYLQCVVQDICGDANEGFCLAPPGMCPGHFDISPSQVNRLGSCKVLLLFDFQGKVESSLSGLKENGLKTFLIKSYPGMCIPQVYLDTCEEICNLLSEEFPEKKDLFEHRLNLVRERMKNLGTDLQTKIKDSGLTSLQVIASGHQADFANWLGLETIAKFSGSDSETPNNINECLNIAKQSNVKYIIANKQEGTYLADSLADRLNLNTVIFSNFPDSTDNLTGFDTLVRQNVKEIIEANQK